jgi:hypothetical protein
MERIQGGRQGTKFGGSAEQRRMMNAATSGPHCMLSSTQPSDPPARVWWSGRAAVCSATPSGRSRHGPPRPPDGPWCANPQWLVWGHRMAVEGRTSAVVLTGSLPKPTSPRISHGRCPAAKPSKNSHSRGDECLEVCWLPGATSTASTSRRLAIM